MRCVSCQRENPEDARFCNGCGVRLGSNVHLRGRSPRAYTPAHLADRILTTRGALEGERKQVTVLFVDVQGSMDLSSGVDIEEWHRLLDRFFAIVSEGVHRYEGTINQYTGDGVMALFGAPLAHEDHAHRACYAALHLEGAVRRYAQELRREQGLDFQVRMGLNSGEVVVGRIGDDLRMDYTAQGQTVGLAARMQQLAEVGRTYLTDDTATLVRGFFELEELGEFKLKGARAPVRTWALGRGEPGRTRLDLARSRGLARFVGRARELERLEEALGAAARGAGRVVCVVGEPGVGKSRLCHEFLQRCRTGGFPIGEARGVAHGDAIPFLPVREYLRDAFGIREDDADAAARQKVAGALLEVDPTLADDLPLLFEFLGVPDPDSPAPPVEAEGRERRVFSALVRVARARAEQGLAVVHLEDLHWFDAGSRAVVRELARAVPSARLLLLANFRPEFDDDWLADEGVSIVRLDPLGDAAARELLGEWLGTDPSVADLAERIAGRAAGNPFFIEELVRSLVEEGALLGARGAYRLARSLESTALPATLHALVAARIDRLGEAEKELLQTAAVIGKEFAESILRVVAPLPDPEFQQALDVLQAAGFVHEESAEPERELAFTHPVTQEVAFHTQLSERRTSVHSAVAAALTEVYRDTPGEHAALVAHHWERAGNALAAARWTHRAARWVGASDVVEAMALWRKLRGLLAAAPQTLETAYLGAASCRWQLFLAVSLGMSREEADELLREGRGWSELNHDDRSLAVTLANYGMYRSFVCVEPEEYVAAAREALEIARRTEDASFERALRIRLAIALVVAGRFAEAVDIGGALASEAGEGLDSGVEGPDGHALSYALGECWTELGDLHQSALCLDRALAEGRPESVRSAHNKYVLRAALTGEAGLAAAHAPASLRIAEKSGNTNGLMQALDVAGLDHQLHGRWREAIACGEQSLALTEEHGVGRISEHLHRAHLARALLGAGELERAREQAERAVRLAASGGPRYAPRAHLTLAAVLHEQEGAPAAERIESELRAAAHAAERSGARIYEPHIREARARLAGLRGDVAEERRGLTRARDLYAQLAMPAHEARLAGELAP